MNKQSVAEELPYEISPEDLGRLFSWFSDRVLVRGQISLQRSRRRSFLLGLSGVLALVFAAMTTFIGVAKWFSDFDWPDDGPSEQIIALMACSIYALVASTLAIASFVPLMGARRLTIRFAVAILVNLLIFAMLSALIVLFGEPDIDWDDMPDVALMILAFVVGVGGVAISLQIWSSISFRPLPSGLDLPSRTSILDLMELMLVVACSIAIFRLVGPPENMTLTMVVSGTIGFCFGVQLIPFFLGYFANPIRWPLLALAFGLTFAVSGICVGLIIAQDDFYLIASDSAALTIALGGFLGASIYFVATIAAFWWLRGCGWVVVRRNGSNRTVTVKETELANPSVE